MNDIEKLRMHALADALDKLEPKRFTFAIVVRHGTSCGTVGCAMGWTPAVFPTLVEWTGEDCAGLNQGNGLRMNGEFVEYHQAASRLFGIPEEMALQLFSPVEAYEWDDGPRTPKHDIHPELPSLEDSATSKEVAGLLRTFIALVENGEIKVPNTQPEAQS